MADSHDGLGIDGRDGGEDDDDAGKAKGFHWKQTQDKETELRMTSGFDSRNAVTRRALKK